MLPSSSKSRRREEGRVDDGGGRMVDSAVTDSSAVSLGDDSSSKLERKGRPRTVSNSHGFSSSTYRSWSLEIYG